MLDGASWRVQHEARMATTTAWLTAAFTRQKKLPSLKKVLGEKEQKARPVRQSPAVMAQIVKALHAKLGGELIHG